MRKTDPLPKQLCTICVEKINWCDEFDCQCIKAEDTLSSIFKEKQTFENSEQITNEIICDEKSCPLCLEGKMSTNQSNVISQSLSLYESDIIIESSDEERVLTNLNIDQKSSENSSIIFQYLGNSEKYLKCTACMNLYHTKETLDNHKCKPPTQNTSKTYKCTLCEANFSFEERLNFHLQFHNNIMKPLYCEICKLTFPKELKLYFHYKRYHCEDQAVSCLQCGQLFQRQEELKVHVCVDAKIRPHICEVCNKGFSDGYTLKRHVVTHLPEKPYKCNQCSKSFTQKSRLNKHLDGHKIIIQSSQILWKCKECGKVFASNEEAEKHLKCHDETGEVEETVASKIFQCEFCNSYFVETEVLKTHRHQHLLEKPYECEDCEIVHKSFTEAVLDWKQHSKGFKVSRFF